MNRTLWNYIQSRDREGFRTALNQLVLARAAHPRDIEALKRVAARGCGQEPPEQTAESLAVNYFLSGYEWLLPQQARFTLVALGYDRDPETIGWVVSGARRYFGTGYSCVPSDFLILIAVENEATLAVLPEVLEKAPWWSVRVACLTRLAPSRPDDSLAVIQEFRRWILESPPLLPPAAAGWRIFFSCMAVGGLAACFAESPNPLKLPKDEPGPLIEWALERGHAGWLVQELRWLHSHGLHEHYALRNRLVHAGILEAVEFSCEQIRLAGMDDYTHYSVVHDAFRSHPKPLPRNALDACVAVIRRPAHPSRFAHRIEALQLLMEAADDEQYPAQLVRDLVIQLAQSEPDPDVRIAAIGFLPWTQTPDVAFILSGARSHDSSRVRDAAEKILRDQAGPG